MRVCLHTDTFARSKRFGLSRYAHEIHRGLADLGVEAIPASPKSEFGRDPPDWLSAAGFRRLPVDRKLLAPLWSFLPEPKIERWVGDVDLVHSLDVDYPAATGKPWIITLHDLGVLTHPEYFNKAHGWLLRRCLAQARTRAAAVICVSQATADEFLSIAGASAAPRVHVVEQGLGQEFFEPAPPEALQALPPVLRDEPFFLFTGSLSPRKNLPRVLQAFTALAGEIPHRLVVTGAAGWDVTEAEGALAAARATGRIVELGYVSDDLLRALYQIASGFLYPSLYEGFGLPILEAMAAGCPVITSNLPPMSDVAGDAALLVDPRDEGALAGAMSTLAKGADAVEALRAAGRARASAFSWGGCVSRTVDIYRTVLR